MLATAAGYCFADAELPQVVTSEVFYDEERSTDENTYVQEEQTAYNNAYVQDIYVQPTIVPIDVPAWPLAGSDADVYEISSCLFYAVDVRRHRTATIKN